MQIEISVNKPFNHGAYNSSSLRVSLPPTLPLFADKGDRVFATRQIKKRKHTMTKIRILPREVQTIRIHNISTRTVEKTHPKCETCFSSQTPTTISRREMRNNKQNRQASVENTKKENLIQPPKSTKINADSD